MVLTCLILFIGISYLNHELKFYQEKIYPNVSADMINIGGMTKNEAFKMLSNLYNKNTDFIIEFYYENQAVATSSAKEIAYNIPIKLVVDQAFLIGRTKNNLSSLYQKIFLSLHLERYNFSLNPNFDQGILTTRLKQINDAYYIAPQEGRFEFNNNKVSAFQLDKPGMSLDINQVLLDLEKSLNNQKKQPKKTIKAILNKIVIQPKIKLSSINKLGINELVSQGVSHYQGSGVERAFNIKFGSNRINGIVIQPGETFSFNKNIGDISIESGFKPAYIIREGRTVLGDGGGICQVSTTLFRTALNAGLPILERNAHAYRVSYYEQDSKPGFDATIYTPTEDLKFKNNYNHALLLQTNVDEETMTLTFDLYGTKDNRSIEISDVTMWNAVSAPPAEYIDDPNIPEGITKQVDFAAPGLSTKFSYKVMKDNQTLTNQEFISNFKPWKAIYLVGKKTN